MKIFGIEHFIYLIIFLMLATAGLICAKKFAKTERHNILLLNLQELLCFYPFWRVDCQLHSAAQTLNGITCFQINFVA